MGARSLEALVVAAVSATGAQAGWVLAAGAGELSLVAYCGDDEPQRFVGQAFAVAGAGSAGLVAATGQPMAVRPRPGDALVGAGAMALRATPPSSYVSVPCADSDGIAGVLEVVDKSGGSGFDIDDIELLSLLGDIAAAILREQALDAQPGPAAPTSTLDGLAATSPAVHAALVELIGAIGRSGDA